MGLIDTYVRQDLGAWQRMQDATRRAARRVRHMPWTALADYAKSRLVHRGAPAGLPDTLPQALRRVHEAMTHALESYRPRPFDGGPLVYLRAAVPLGGYCDPLPVWRRTARAGLRVVPLPGEHLDLVRTTSADAARAIDETLADKAINVFCELVTYRNT